LFLEFKFEVALCSMGHVYTFSIFAAGGKYF